MKKVVWLNPVVKNIYDFAALKEILQNKGFSVVECEKDHVKSVKKRIQKRSRAKGAYLR